MKNPKILYKYRFFDEKNLLALKNNQIYFSCPLHFNDPFDCVSFENLFDFQAETLELLALMHPEIEPSMINRDKTLDLIKALNEHPEILRIKHDQEKNLKEYIEKMGILSLSKRNDSILMWSHYADSHKGFCVGYKNNLGLDPQNVRPVIYSQNRNNDFVYQYLSNQNLNINQAIENFKKNFILTKHQDWSYENEWRIISAFKGLHNYQPNCVDAIIFGLKMPMPHRKELINLFKDKPVSFYECIKDKHNFKILIKPYLQKNE